MNTAELENAHLHSSANKIEYEKSNNAGCFYCQEIYSPKEIDTWIENNATPLCPKCGIDAVIGDYSGYEISPQFLFEMNKYWFGA